MQSEEDKRRAALLQQQNNPLNWTQSFFNILRTPTKPGLPNLAAPLQMPITQARQPVSQVRLASTTTPTQVQARQPVSQVRLASTTTPTQVQAPKPFTPVSFGLPTTKTPSLQQTTSQIFKIPTIPTSPNVIELANQKQNYLNQITKLAEQGNVPKYIPGGGLPKGPFAPGSQVYQLPGVSESEFKAAQEKGIQTSMKTAYEQKYGTPGERAYQQLEQKIGPAAALTSFNPVSIGQYILATPQRIYNTLTQRPGTEKNKGIMQVLYGTEPVGSYTQISDATYKLMNESNIPIVKSLAPAAPALAPILAGVDLLSGGFFSKPAKRAAEKELAKTAEQQLNRTITSEEKKALSNFIAENQPKIKAGLTQEPPVTPKLETPVVKPTVAEVPENLLTKIVNEKKPTDIANAVKIIIPQIDKITLDATVQDIAKLTDVNQVRDVINSIKEVKTLADASIQPVTTPRLKQAPVKTEAQPTIPPTQAAIAAPVGAPEAPQAIQQARIGIPPQQAITPPEVPITPPQQAPFVSTIEQNVAAIEAAKKANKISIFNVVRDTLARQLKDPFYLNQKLEDAITKSRGLKLGSLPLNDRPTYLQEKILLSSDENRRLLETPTVTGERFVDVMNHWVKKNDGKDFVDWLNQRFALEIYDKSGGKIWKYPQFKVEDVRRSVQQFAIDNPNALKDAATVKGWADMLIDKGIEAGEITKEFGDIIKNRYANYVPLSSVYDEELIKPVISGGLRNVGEQNVVRFLTESAGTYDNTFTALMARGNQVIQKANINKNNELFYRLIKNGELKPKDFELVLDPVKTRQQAEILSQLVPLRDTIKKATAIRGKLATQKKISRLELENAQNLAAEAARQYLIIQAVDNKGISFAKRLSKAELLDLFQVIVDADAANVTRIANKYIKKGEQYSTVIEQLQGVRNIISEMKGEASDLYKASQVLSQKVPTNINKITGFTNGEKFVIKINNPRFAKELESIKKLNEANKAENMSIWRKASEAVTTGQKILVTGPFAPQFIVKDIVRQQGLKFTNLPGLSAFGARPITIGYFSGLTRTGTPFNKLVEAGMNVPKGTKSSYTSKYTVRQLAAYSNKLDRLKFSIANPKEWWNVINNFAAAPTVADRTQVGLSAYYRAKRLNPNITDAEAWAIGANEANNALGNFRRVSALAKAAEPIAPYTGATQSGYRALMRAFKVRPVETTLKVGSIMSAVVATTYYMAQQYKEYYDDLIKDGKTNDLDTNLIILNPLSYKDEKTGDWKNITKIPIAPDFKPLNIAAWKTGYALANGQAPDLGVIAQGFGDFYTAGMKDNIWGDPKYTSGVGQILPQSPVKNIVMIGIGVRPNDGKPLADNYTAEKARNLQFTDYTSENAKALSNILGGFLTPQQIDELANKGGLLGDILQAKDSPKEAAIAPFRRIFSETNARTSEQKMGSDYYKIVGYVKKNILKDKKQYELFDALQQKHTNDLGQPTEKGKLDSATTALTLLGNPQILESQIYINNEMAKQGKDSNPLYDNTLSPEQRRAVLTYRSMRINNAAKQNYTKNGESAFVSLGLDEAWYQNFKTKEDAYWKKVEDKKKANGIDSTDYNQTYKTFSGSPQVVETPAIKAKLEFYYKLPKGTGERSAFLNNNPDVLEYWTRQNVFANEERAALGFKPLTTQDKNYQRPAQDKNYQRPVRNYLADLLKNVQAPTGLTSIADIKLKSVKQYKVKLPAVSRQKARIKLQ